MHPVQRGATARGFDLVGHGTDRATPREGASERERGEGGDQFVTQQLLLPIYKREEGAEIERDFVTFIVCLQLPQKNVRFCLL